MTTNTDVAVLLGGFKVLAQHPNHGQLDGLSWAEAVNGFASAVAPLTASVHGRQAMIQVLHVDLELALT